MGRLVKRAGRIVPAPVLEAREQAQAILAAAHARAATLIGEAERAREQARQQGYDDGRAAAAAELTETLAGAALEAARVRARAEPEALRFAGALAAKLAAKMTEKILGRALDVEPALTADLVERALVASRARAGVVRLRVHPADLALLEGDETRRRLRAHLDARAVLQIDADPAVSRYGCVVETAAVRLDARLESQIAALERAVAGEAGHG